jgi:hypothetical protein
MNLEQCQLAAMTLAAQQPPSTRRFPLLHMCSSVLYCTLAPPFRLERAPTALPLPPPSRAFFSRSFAFRMHETPLFAQRRECEKRILCEKRNRFSTVKTVRKANRTRSEPYEKRGLTVHESIKICEYGY